MTIFCNSIYFGNYYINCVFLADLNLGFPIQWLPWLMRKEAIRSVPALGQFSQVQSMLNSIVSKISYIFLIKKLILRLCCQKIKMLRVISYVKINLRNPLMKRSHFNTQVATALPFLKRVSKCSDLKTIVHQRSTPCNECCCPLLQCYQSRT